MRFDDMIATALAHSDEQPLAHRAKWRQLVDLIAQRRDAENEQAIVEALAWLEDSRARIPLDERRRILLSFAGLRVSPRLMALVNAEHPAIAAPLFATCRLDPEEWIALLPTLGPTGRGLLRHRRDLTADVQRALAAFGTSDFALPPGTMTENPEGEAQIRDLVARIEAYRRTRPARIVEPAPLTESDGFRWETGADGVILWVEGAPRGAIVGESIAAIAERGGQGVDGQAAGAFAKRAPFRDARFSVGGQGPGGGEWRISGIPCFDPARGSFLGYRGTARRPRADEVARPSAEGLFGSTMPADSLRQLIHELRTPLNAILGFAEMIDGQYLGPTAQPYRHRAEDIMAQAGRLLAAVEDLDMAARIETRRYEAQGTATDAAALLERLCEALRPAAEARGSALALHVTPDLARAAIGADDTERVYARLLSATIGLAGREEWIAVSLGPATRDGRPFLALSVDRPEGIRGLDEAHLLDPGYSPEGDWPAAPALGLGFALRLVRNLAAALGGALDIADTRFILYLPAVDAAGQAEDQPSEISP